MAIAKDLERACNNTLLRIVLHGNGHTGRWFMSATLHAFTPLHSTAPSLWPRSGLWRDMGLLQREPLACLCSKLFTVSKFPVQVGLTVEELSHLPHDGPVPPGTIPDEAHLHMARHTWQGFSSCCCCLAQAGKCFKHGLQQLFVFRERVYTQKYPCCYERSACGDSNPGVS